MGLYQTFDAVDVAEVVFAEGVKCRVRSTLHPKMRALEKHQLKKYRSHLGGSTVPEAIETDIEVEKAAMAIESWEGVTDPEGKELPCTPVNAAKVLRDLPYFRKEVLFVISQLATFQKQELAELGKDSGPSSAPTSSTPTAETSPSA